MLRSHETAVHGILQAGMLLPSMPGKCLWELALEGKRCFSNAAVAAAAVRVGTCIVVVLRTVP